MSQQMKTFSLCLAALAAAVTLTATAAAGPEAAKQRVAISMKGLENGTFVLTPLQAGTLKRDSGTVSLVYIDPAIVMREGQRIDVYRNTYTLKGKRGSLSIRERTEFVSVSNEKVPGFDFTPGVGIGTWKVVGGTGSYREGHGRRTEWHAGPPLARAPRRLPHPSIGVCQGGRRTLRVALPFRYSPGSTIATERHRSRTCLASGYDAVLVLKTSWGTGPCRSDTQRNERPRRRSVKLGRRC